MGSEWLYGPQAYRSAGDADGVEPAADGLGLGLSHVTPDTVELVVLLDDSEPPWPERVPYEEPSGQPAAGEGGESAGEAAAQ